MAVAAPERQEVYAQSQGLLYEMGRLTVQEVFEEVARKEAEAYTNFYTRIGEHIKTDPGFRHELDIVHVDRFQVVSGQAVAKDGTPVVSLVEAGHRASELAAQSDLRMQTQAIRDAADVEVARAVDTLLPGECLRVVSMDPKAELANDKKFWEGKNYREGIAYIQSYYKSLDGREVLAGAYSVDHSDLEAWRRVQARNGVHIPQGTSANHWIRYAKREFIPEAEALETPLKWRDEYYKEVAKNRTPVSLSEYLQLNQRTIDMYFSAYIKPLSQAIYTGKNGAEMQQFAQTILGTVSKNKINPDKLENLMQVAINDEFSAENGRVIEECICYAMVEELRTGLQQFVNVPRKIEAAQAYVEPVRYVYTELVAEQLYQMNIRAAQRINEGVKAGRSYGGCSGASMGIQSDEQDGTANSQDVYGNKAEGAESKSEKGVMRCVNCPKCRTYHHELRAKSGVFRCKNDKCGHTALAG